MESWQLLESLVSPSDGEPRGLQDVEERGGNAEEGEDQAAGRRDQADAEALPPQGHGVPRYTLSKR